VRFARFPSKANSVNRLESGSEFSILDPEGNPIELFLSKSDFQARFGKLFEEFETAVAEAVTIDASMY